MDEALQKAREIAQADVKIQMDELRATIRNLNLGDMTEFKLLIVQLRKDISELKSDLLH